MVRARGCISCGSEPVPQDRPSVGGRLHVGAQAALISSKYQYDSDRALKHHIDDLAQVRAGRKGKKPLLELLTWIFFRLAALDCNLVNKRCIIIASAVLLTRLDAGHIGCAPTASAILVCRMASLTEDESRAGPFFTMQSPPQRL
jgi:hypothetical protein